MYKTLSQNSYWISSTFLIEVFSTQKSISTLCHVCSNYDAICSHIAVSLISTFVRAGTRNSLLSIWCGSGQFYCQHLLALTGHYFTLRVLAMKAMKKTWVFIFSCWKFWKIQILPWKIEMLETNWNRIFFNAVWTKKKKKTKRKKVDIYLNIYKKWNSIFFFPPPISPFEIPNVRQPVHFLIHLNFYQISHWSSKRLAWIRTLLKQHCVLGQAVSVGTQPKLALVPLTLYPRSCTILLASSDQELRARWLSESSLSQNQELPAWVPCKAKGAGCLQHRDGSAILQA